MEQLLSHQSLSSPMYSACAPVFVFALRIIRGIGQISFDVRCKIFDTIAKGVRCDPAGPVLRIFGAGDYCRLHIFRQDFGADEIALFTDPNFDMDVADRVMQREQGIFAGGAAFFI
ncbi:hypothetical protein AUQ37_04640 [Candidatus Methanomethylophilus sp. 1R26]|nr:hypothetical protein AUQ37_04640 [Candidatus Methanomethylophilus sp. 1R26]